MQLEAQKIPRGHLIAAPQDGAIPGQGDQGVAFAQRPEGIQGAQAALQFIQPGFPASQMRFSGPMQPCLQALDALLPAVPHLGREAAFQPQALAAQGFRPGLYEPMPAALQPFHK